MVLQIIMTLHSLKWHTMMLIDHFIKFKEDGITQRQRNMDIYQLEIEAGQEGFAYLNLKEFFTIM